jgi:hypothetical protein
MLPCDYIKEVDMGITETLKTYEFPIKILRPKHIEGKSHVTPMYITVGKIILKWNLNK